VGSSDQALEAVSLVRVLEVDSLAPALELASPDKTPKRQLVEAEYWRRSTGGSPWGRSLWQLAQVLEAVSLVRAPEVDSSDQALEAVSLARAREADSSAPHATRPPRSP